MADVPNQAIWNYYQSECLSAFDASRTRLRILLGMVEGSRVLNIGVGAGLFEVMALEKGLDVYALDPDPVAIERLATKLELKDKAQTGVGDDLPFADGYFDTVVITEVIEHLIPQTIEGTLLEIRRVLKPGGKIIGTVPARENLSEQMTVCPDCHKAFHRWGHQRSFTDEDIRGLLQAAGFGSISSVERPIVDLEHVNYKGKIVGLMKLLMWRMGSHGSGENVLFAAHSPAVAA